MKSLFNAVAVAGVIGFLAAILCYIFGAIPHLGVLRTYDDLIGLAVGIIVFIKHWDFNF